MNFINQHCCLSELEMFASHRRQNILIAGSVGCGKSYLAKQYANMLGIVDFQIVDAKVNTIREVIDTCYQVGNPVVLCIENLDIGTVAASYTILKFLEEPAPNVYLVITCRNIDNIPDTIVSRCAIINVPHVVSSDLVHYALSKDAEQYKLLSNTNVWACATSFTDVDTLLMLNSAQLSYISNIYNVLNSGDCVSSIVWNLQKFPDGTPTPTELVFRYILRSAPSPSAWNSAHACLQSMQSGNISTHATLSKFVFMYKYVN